MGKDEFDQLLLQKTEYMIAFKNGYNRVLYSDNPEEVEVPSVFDNTSFSSMGDYDGANYADYCIRTGQRWDIKPDNLMANMDKYFTQALNNYMGLSRDTKTKYREIDVQDYIDNDESLEEVTGY